MTRPLTGKRYFAWLGWMDAQTGHPLLHSRHRRLLWPMWARRAYTSAWLDYPQRENL